MAPGQCSGLDHRAFGLVWLHGVLGQHERLKFVGSSGFSGLRDDSAYQSFFIRLRLPIAQWVSTLWDDSLVYMEDED